MPPLQPFAMPGPPPATGSQQAGYGQPAPGNGQPAPGYGQPPGHPQQYGGYQPYPGTARAAVRPPRDPALAEWWQRLLARLIDGIVVGLLVAPLTAVMFPSKWHRLQVLAQEARYVTPATQHAYLTTFNNVLLGMAGTLVLIGLAAAVLKFGYDWLQHGLWGQTLGKRALGTKVVMADGRTRVTGAAAGTRAAVYALGGGLPSVGFFWWVIDCLWLLWDPQHQCLHDKAGRTVVVKAKTQPGPAQPAPPSPR